MIGDQVTGTIPGAHITSVAHEGLRAVFDGQPALLAIISPDGKILASGSQVAIEAEAVAINCYRNFLKGAGHLRVLSPPIAATGHKAAQG